MSFSDDKINDATLTAIGITLIGVIVGIAVTIAISLQSITVWQRILIAIIIIVILMLTIKLLTQKGTGTGPISMIGLWLMK